MKKQMKTHLKVKACLIATVLMITQLVNLPVWQQTTVLGAEEQASSKTNAVSNIQDGVTLHCWNWSYKNIEANMKLIAEQGFTAIQTSPIQQAKESTKGKPMGTCCSKKRRNGALSGTSWQYVLDIRNSINYRLVI